MLRHDPSLWPNRYCLETEGYGEHFIARDLRRLEISPRIIESRSAHEMDSVLPAPA